MGAAARRIAHTAAPARPALRVVPGGHRGRSRTSHAPEVFRGVALCLVVLALAGIVRVTLAASAAEAVIDAWELKTQVKAERVAARTLEADKSALAAPSRIEAVASQTLNMSRPTQVAYLEIADEEPIAPAASGSSERDENRAAPKVLSTLLGLAAGEGQVMLVGDVGLGSLR